MQESSPSIGTLASALAKAQADLINPEKSLIAIIRRDGPKGTAQTFRYAPLSSGLDIVRKVLGQHEIATIQTTSIDQAAGIINLTTVLAHASGEWVASDWPVCTVTEIATPQRMGMALTYARRYALFTMVGIAGEDDLDAPDLPTLAANPVDAQKLSEGTSGRRNRTADPAHPSRDGKLLARPPHPILASSESAQLRDRLSTEIADLLTDDDVAVWVRRSLSQKNKLTAADAECLEQAFAAKLTALGTNVGYKSADRPETINPPLNVPTARKRSQTKLIDKSTLQLPEARRLRDREHVRFVAQQSCLVCGRRPADAHHLRFAQSRALARKVSDEFTVPLCRGHHREIHRSGDEAAWWRRTGINPTAIARSLWLKSHPLPGNSRNGRRRLVSLSVASIDPRRMANPTKMTKQTQLSPRLRDDIV